MALVMLQDTWELWSRGRIHNQVQAARHLMWEARRALEEPRDSITLEDKKAWTDYYNAMARELVTCARMDHATGAEIE